MVEYRHKARGKPLQGVKMQNAIVNLVTASGAIVSAFCVGSSVKNASDSDVKTSTLLACRLFYVGGLVLGCQGLLVLFR